MAVVGPFALGVGVVHDKGKASTAASLGPFERCSGGCSSLQTFHFDHVEIAGISWIYETFCMPGGCQVPSPGGRIEGVVSFGQYNRRTR